MHQINLLTLATSCVSSHRSNLEASGAVGAEPLHATMVMSSKKLFCVNWSKVLTLFLLILYQTLVHRGPGAGKAWPNWNRSALRSRPWPAPWGSITIKVLTWWHEHHVEQKNRESIQVTTCWSFARNLFSIPCRTPRTTHHTNYSLNWNIGGRKLPTNASACSFETWTC